MKVLYKGEELHDALQRGVVDVKDIDYNEYGVFVSDLEKERDNLLERVRELEEELEYMMESY